MAGKGSLANAQDALYSLSRSDFHDITSGSNGYSATSGYDLASGLGSPIANLVIRDLVSYNGSTNFSVAAATGSVTRFRFLFFTTSGFGGFGRFDTKLGDAAAARAGMPFGPTPSSIVSSEQPNTLLTAERSTGRGTATSSPQTNSDNWTLDDALATYDGHSIFRGNASTGAEKVGDGTCSAAVEAAWANASDAALSLYSM